MELTGAGLIQEKSYHHFRFALTFEPQQGAAH